MDPTVLVKAVIDEAFKLIEQKEAGHPLVVATLSWADGVIDDKVIPLIIDALKAKGLL